MKWQEMQHCVSSMSPKGEADIYCRAEGKVIYAQLVGGRERWASKGPTLIGDLVWLACPH